MEIWYSIFISKYFKKKSEKKKIWLVDFFLYFIYIYIYMYTAVLTYKKYCYLFWYISTQWWQIMKQFHSLFGKIKKILISFVNLLDIVLYSFLNISKMIRSVISKLETKESILRSIFLYIKLTVTRCSHPIVFICPQL